MDFRLIKGFLVSMLLRCDRFYCIYQTLCGDCGGGLCPNRNTVFQVQLTNQTLKIIFWYWQKVHFLQNVTFESLVYWLKEVLNALLKHFWLCLNVIFSFDDQLVNWTKCFNKKYSHLNKLENWIFPVNDLLFFIISKRQLLQHLLIDTIKSASH